MEKYKQKPDRTNFRDLEIDGFPVKHRGAGWYALVNADQGYASWQWMKELGPKPESRDIRMIQMSN